MKKTFTNADAKEILTGLQYALNTDAQLPVRTGFKIAKNADELKRAVKIYDLEHDRIILSYFPEGTMDIKKDPKGFADCQNSLRELAEIEIDIDIAPCKEEELTGDFPARAMSALLAICGGGVEG